MKVIWPCPWFGDYRVPVFKRLNELLDGNFLVFYSRRANQTKSIASSVNLKKLYAFWDDLNTTRRHLQIALNPRMMTQDMLFKYKDIFPKRR